MWAISKKRKKEKNFNGANIIFSSIKNTEKIRIGIESSSNVIPRHDNNLFDNQNNLIGIVTSGSYSPSLKKPIAMGIVNIKYSKVGTNIYFESRGIKNRVIVTELPFVSTGTTDGFTDDYDMVCPYDAPGSPDVVYLFDSPGGSFDISVCESGYDTKLYIYNTVMEPIDCNDDACENSALRLLVWMYLSRLERFLGTPSLAYPKSKKIIKFPVLAFKIG